MFFCWDGTSYTKIGVKLWSQSCDVLLTTHKNQVALTHGYTEWKMSLHSTVLEQNVNIPKARVHVIVSYVYIWQWRWLGVVDIWIFSCELFFFCAVMAPCPPCQVGLHTPITQIWRDHAVNGVLFVVGIRGACCTTLHRLNALGSSLCPIGQNPSSQPHPSLIIVWIQSASCLKKACIMKTLVGCFDLMLLPRFTWSLLCRDDNFFKQKFGGFLFSRKR